MGVRSKTLITVILVGLVVGVFSLQVSNKNLFKGQIFDSPEEAGEGDTPVDSLNEATAMPDLQPLLELIKPTEAGDDLEANVTIQNSGEGDMEGGVPFRYTISINETEVFSNTDSYSVLGVGDSFNFSYPIPRSIYQYPDKGSVTLSLDVDNSIAESNENNNKITIEYSL